MRRALQSGACTGITCEWDWRRESEGRAEWKSASVQVTQETAGNFALRCCPSAYRQASKSELANLECLRPANLKT
jgi:hypothetical protein